MLPSVGLVRFKLEQLFRQSEISPNESGGILIDVATDLLQVLVLVGREIFIGPASPKRFVCQITHQ